MSKNHDYEFNPAPLIRARDGRPKTLMADRLGVSRQLYSFYEAGGFPSVKVLARIMKEFRLSFSDLVRPVKRSGAQSNAQAASAREAVDC